MLIPGIVILEGSWDVIMRGTCLKEREREGGRNRGRQGRGEEKREKERNKRGGKEGGKKEITTEGREEVGRGKMDGWRERS